MLYICFRLTPFQMWYFKMSPDNLRWNHSMSWKCLSIDLIYKSKNAESNISEFKWFKYFTMGIENSVGWPRLTSWMLGHPDPWMLGHPTALSVFQKLCGLSWMWPYVNPIVSLCTLNELMYCIVMSLIIFNLIYCIVCIYVIPINNSIFTYRAVLINNVLFSVFTLVHIWRSCFSNVQGTACYSLCRQIQISKTKISPLRLIQCKRVWREAKRWEVLHICHMSKTSPCLSFAHLPFKMKPKAEGWKADVW